MATQRIADDPGIRGGSPFDQSQSNAPANARGGYGAETSGVENSELSSKIHSARGFRRALKSTQSRGNKLADQLPSRNSASGPGYAKPNYFAQGGKRRGLHIGSGAPFTGAAQSEGADV